MTCVTCNRTPDEITELRGFAMMLARPFGDKRRGEYLECWWCARERRRAGDEAARRADEQAERSGV